ncbi:L,D-transpeptidase [Phyllobacterium leguminum]|uniref:Lipoprotein-anchoring transpeptidase ErfK/SrfK n=1 Tax=Phyllobacterium leguminum TaxID=314237 RepID=A0A318SZT5_9HYPH|nr:L,D-transpeptidase [Phyllobacterium leguminum]PYE85317.1 lipoprotein-anchoring transpeptidase ErfK/SrfK [Phyllobacterium leguminum]
MENKFSRRSFLALSAVTAVGLSGCTTVARNIPIIDVGPDGLPIAPRPTAPAPNAATAAALGSYATMYAAVEDGGFSLPAIPIQKIDPKYLRQIVPDPTGEQPGTIVVDTANRFLYLVREGGQAIRYGVGIGRAGFAWSGRAIIQYKRKWPTWTPPAEMITRQPELAQYSAANGGMAPGPKNPLGARALYLFQNGQDTGYRLHGNPEWWSIGKAMSSGCVRLMNQDIIDLYDRVPAKTPVLVM